MSNSNEQKQQERKKEFNAKYADAKRDLEAQVIHILTLDKVSKLFPDNSLEKRHVEYDLKLAKNQLVNQYMYDYENTKRSLEVYTNIRPPLTKYDVIYDA